MLMSAKQEGKKMTNYEFKKAIEKELFITLMPTKEDIDKLMEKFGAGEIPHPATTCKGLCNYRTIKTDAERTKLQNIVANCLLFGLSHDDITSNANVVWDLIDNK